MPDANLSASAIFAAVTASSTIFAVVMASSSIDAVSTVIFVTAAPDPAPSAKIKQSSSGYGCVRPRSLRKHGRLTGIVVNKVRLVLVVGANKLYWCLMETRQARGLCNGRQP